MQNLSPTDLKILFLGICRALTFDALRLKPREKQLVLLLATESFGEGSPAGELHIAAWRARLENWRSNELNDLLTRFEQWNWVVLDQIEGRYRLLPDRLPGWQDCVTGQLREGHISLTTPDDLNKMVAAVSQQKAFRNGFTLQGMGGGNLPCENFAKPGERSSETFKRLTSERINISETLPCENFAVKLKMAVREFVGEKDWSDPQWWNGGTGYRHQLFIDEHPALQAALNYCRAGLSTGESRLKKTRGSMLWDQFQRTRHLPEYRA